MFEWFFILPFLLQFFIVSLIFIPITFFVILLFELGPFQSASPLSGGLGVALVVIVDIIGAFIGFGLGGNARFLAAPFVSCIWIALIAATIGYVWDRLLRLAAKAAAKFGGMQIK